MEVHGAWVYGAAGRCGVLQGEPQGGHPVGTYPSLPLQSEVLGLGASDPSLRSLVDSERQILLALFGN